MAVVRKLLLPCRLRLSDLRAICQSAQVEEMRCAVSKSRIRNLQISDLSLTLTITLTGTLTLPNPHGRP